MGAKKWACSQTGAGERYWRNQNQKLDKDICMTMRMIQEREKNDIEEKRIATTMFLSKP